jgi:hypothetical protein
MGPSANPWGVWLKIWAIGQAHSRARISFRLALDARRQVEPRFIRQFAGVRRTARRIEA